jgi:hypothetical protein
LAETFQETPDIDDQNMIPHEWQRRSGLDADLLSFQADCGILRNRRSSEAATIITTPKKIETCFQDVMEDASLMNFQLFLTFHNCFRGCYTLWLVKFLTAQNMGSPMVLALTQERRVGFAKRSVATPWETECKAILA